jgi:hypothetical protein
MAARSPDLIFLSLIIPLYDTILNTKRDWVICASVTPVDSFGATEHERIDRYYHYGTTTRHPESRNLKASSLHHQLRSNRTAGKSRQFDGYDRVGSKKEGNIPIEGPIEGDGVPKTSKYPRP